MIPLIDAQALKNHDADALKILAYAVENTGFLLLSNTDIPTSAVENILKVYSDFFHSDEENKSAVDMAKTGSNRGWGRSYSEQVDSKANPDYKEVYDCGVAVAKDDPQAHLSVYAPSMWPEKPDNFQEEVETYFTKARQVALTVLEDIATALELDAGFFADKFDKPMALLRSNYYPKRPVDATDNDFGIAAHTDYGCLTLLATDGTQGLEVKMKDGKWQTVNAAPGTFIINFGEMLEIWSRGKIKATLHRVVGGNQERISIPLFFNPNYNTNVAPEGEAKIIAGEYLANRYQETYLHLKDKD